MSNSVPHSLNNHWVRYSPPVKVHGPSNFPLFDPFIACPRTCIFPSDLTSSRDSATTDSLHRDKALEGSIRVSKGSKPTFSCITVLVTLERRERISPTQPLIAQLSPNLYSASVPAHPFERAGNLQAVPWPPCIDLSNNLGAAAGRVAKDLQSKHDTAEDYLMNQEGKICCSAAPVRNR